MMVMQLRVARIAGFCLWLVLLSAGCAPQFDAQPTPRPLGPTAIPAASPTPAPAPVQYVVIGKAHGEYWDAVERGMRAAAQQLKLPAGSVAFYAPEKEDAAAQILAVERFVAQGVQGIALAPSDQRALDLAIRQAREAGVWLTTFDTDAPESQRLFFVGTPQSTIGREAGAALLKLMNGRTGKAALGSTLLDEAARDRIAAFKATLGAAKWTVLDAVGDKLDVALAAQAVKTSLNANKDLAAAFGVYAYNSLAWCHAVRDTQASQKLVVVGFDVSAESVACLKDGALDALIIPRPFLQGQQSVLALDSLEHNGLIETANALHLDTSGAPANWIVDTGVDVVTLQGAAGMALVDYAAKVDGEQGTREWQP